MAEVETMLCSACNPVTHFSVYVSLQPYVRINFHVMRASWRGQLRSRTGSDRMASETRTLGFSNAEAMGALMDYCVSTKRELPKGGIKRLTFSNADEIKVTAEFDGGAPSVSFYEHEVAVALIMLCNKKGIPVPKRAAK